MPEYNVMELMVCVASRELEDGVSVGVGTGVPCAATMLAQKTHAPNILIVFEAGGVAPLLPEMPISVGDSRTFYKGIMASGMVQIMETCARGTVDYTFLGGAQIDMYGNMNSTQMNIRGSSGYSRGVGSRVLFLIDGIPILTGDTREVSYDVIPTYLIERVEIVKGAGSALYGSSALGGVVNMMTKEIDQLPHYYLKMYGGLHSQTAYPQWNWSDKSRSPNRISRSQEI